MRDFIDAFRIEIQNVFGQVDFLPVPDGQIHREKAPGDKAGSKNLWYVLFPGEQPGGAFGNWKDGATHNWSHRGTANRQDTEALLAKIEAAKRQRQAETRKRQEEATRLACNLYRQAGSTLDHPYLAKKQITTTNHKARQRESTLLVPLYDVNAIGSKLVNLQRIYPDGSKRFLPGGKVKGCFSPIGTISPDNPIYICEGWATGCTIHQNTGHPVACAMNAGNLVAVADAISRSHPHLQIILAADSDRNTPGNPGATKATEAALRVGGLICIPSFCQSNCDCTDFNDVDCCNRAGGGNE